MSYIYQIINKVNGKSYIGQTINFKSRKKGHIRATFYDIRQKDKPLYRAIRKYGKDNFIWKILFQDYCHPNKLSNLEIFFIAYYDTRCPNGYNITNGGEYGNTMSNHPNKKEIYKKMSKSRIERKIAAGQNNPCSKTNMSKEKELLKQIK